MVFDEIKEEIKWMIEDSVDSAVNTVYSLKNTGKVIKKHPFASLVCVLGLAYLSKCAHIDKQLNPLEQEFRSAAKGSRKLAYNENGHFTYPVWRGNLDSILDKRDEFLRDKNAICINGWHSNQGTALDFNVWLGPFKSDKFHDAWKNFKEYKRYDAE